jgi:cytochrome c oxidase subunit IV
MTSHILPVRTYLAVFVALMALLAATVAVNYLPLGQFNVVIALIIAVCKTFLVMLFFMHVRYSGRLIWIYVGVGFFWLGILLALTASDFLTRQWPPFVGR